MTEYLAEISVRRPWLTVGVWVVIVAVGLALIQSLLPSATTTDLRLAGRYESEKAAALLEERLRGPEKLAEIVIVQSPSLTVEDEAFRAKVEAVHQTIVSLGPGKIAGGIDGGPISHFYQLADAGPLVPDDVRQQLLPLMVSADRQTVLIHYTMSGTSQEATANVEDVIHLVEEANEADDFLVLIGGDASVAYENNELAQHDLERGERFGSTGSLAGVVGALRGRRCYNAAAGSGNSFNRGGTCGSCDNRAVQPAGLLCDVDGRHDRAGRRH